MVVPENLQEGALGDSVGISYLTHLHLAPRVHTLRRKSLQTSEVTVLSKYKIQGSVRGRYINSWDSLLCVDGGHGVVVGGRDGEAPHDDAAAAVGAAQ